MVSGVTRPANSPSRRRPTIRPLTAGRRRWSSVQPPAAELLAEHTVLLAQEVDDLSWRALTQPAIQTTRNRTASVPIVAPW